MSIYTRGGDLGETTLGDGSRARKDAPRVEAYGTLDETNSLIGVARVDVSDDLLGGFLLFAQQKLSTCASCVAVPESASSQAINVTAQDISTIERYADAFAEKTGPLTGFILPAGSLTASRLQVARAVARRAERRLVTLAASDDLDSNILSFANRLSDALFAAARYANLLDGGSEEPWDLNAQAAEF